MNRVDTDHWEDDVATCASQADLHSSIDEEDLSRSHIGVHRCPIKNHVFFLCFVCFI